MLQALGSSHIFFSQGPFTNWETIPFVRQCYITAYVTDKTIFAAKDNLSFFYDWVSYSSSSAKWNWNSSGAILVIEELHLEKTVEILNIGQDVQA